MWWWNPGCLMVKPWMFDGETLDVCRQVVQLLGTTHGRRIGKGIIGRGNRLTMVALSCVFLSFRKGAINNLFWVIKFDKKEKHTSNHWKKGLNIIETKKQEQSSHFFSTRSFHSMPWKAPWLLQWIYKKFTTILPWKTSWLDGFWCLPRHLGGSRFPPSLPHLTRKIFLWNPTWTPEGINRKGRNIVVCFFPAIPRSTAFLMRSRWRCDPTTFGNFWRSRVFFPMAPFSNETCLLASGISWWLSWRSRKRLELY